MAKRRVTLKEMAKELGVTVTTVSKALKDYPDIGKETKRRVRELAEEWNYIPDRQAVALRSSKTNTIGLILPEIVHFFFSNVIRGIMDYCENKGYRVLITLSNNEREMEAKQTNLLFSTRVDGILVSLANETNDSEHFQKLNDYGVPIVMFDKIIDDFACNKVVIDDVRGGYLATKHLIDKGCKRIAHLAGPQIPSNAIERKQGYEQALNEAGMTIEADLIKECDAVIFEEGYAFAKELLTSKNPPDGIFAVTDQIGVSVLHAAQDLGIKVPEELKIVGFSDSQIARISKPQLSTIHQPGYEIGEVAARLLINDIEQPDFKVPEHEKVIVDTYLIERGSS